MKQSPTDSVSQYLEQNKNMFKARSGIQNVPLIELRKVFRYTPQISEFLTDLDAAFPALDIPGEWNAYSGQAQLGDGTVPELAIFPNEVALFRDVFDTAIRIARTTPGGGRRVAVLCVSDEMFDTYLQAAEGQYEGKFVPVLGREISEIQHAGRRFIFSIPEYAAGLQFHTVFLINVDSKEVLRDAPIGPRRRFVSSVYLGASRAEEKLIILSCTSRGGPSDVLNMALERGSLREVAPQLIVGSRS